MLLIFFIKKELQSLHLKITLQNNHKHITLKKVEGKKILKCGVSLAQNVFG